MASGVLPLVVGRATRLARFLSQREKTYDADIRLGIATDTYDAAGRPLPAAPSGQVSRRWPDRSEVATALAAFHGTFLQIPPPFSAKKVAGVRAYARARQGNPILPAPVSVTISQLDLHAVEHDHVSLTLTCSAGCYVRSLAHALGERLGCGAHLVGLRRTRSGDFGIEQAVPLDAIGHGREVTRGHMIALERLLPSWPAIVVNERGAIRVTHGQSVGPPHIVGPWPVGTAEAADPEPWRARLFRVEGTLLAIAEASSGTGVLRPTIVLG